MNRAGKIALYFAGLLALVSATCGESLSYTLKPDRETGGISVELAWDTQGRGSSVLGFAQRAGTVGDVAALARDVKFEGVTNTLGSSGPNWTLEHRRGAIIKAKYRIDPGRRELDWDSTHHPVTSETFFHGIGGAFLMTPMMAETEYEVAIHWNIPDGWKAACSWGVGKNIGAAMTTADLRQSAYLAGDLILRESAKGAGHRLALAAAKDGEFDVDALFKMIDGLVGAECDFTQETAFPSLVVTAAPVGKVRAGDGAAAAGTAMFDGLALWLAPGAGASETVQHLFAHELFHYWNGRVLKPADNDKLMYWFVEGFTDYYALRLLRESGEWTDAVFAQWVNRHLRAYAFNPARNATNEQIRNRFWDARDTYGEVAYQRGLMLALRWNRAARDHGVVTGIDGLFRALLDHARSGKFTLTNAALREEGVRRLGPWFGEEFDRFVMQAETVAVPPDALGPLISGAVADVYQYELGFDRAKSLRDKRVQGLIAGSAAAGAGVREGDELVRGSISGDPDRPVELDVRRAGKVQTIRYFPRGEKAQAVQFKAGP